MTADYDPDAWARSQEDEQLAEVRELVDPLCRRIVRREVDEERARELIDRVRLEASYLIPDRMDLYDLIYGSRFERLIDQFLRRGDEGSR